MLNQSFSRLRKSLRSAHTWTRSRGPDFAPAGYRAPSTRSVMKIAGLEERDLWRDGGAFLAGVRKLTMENRARAQKLSRLLVFGATRDRCPRANTAARRSRGSAAA